MSTHEHKDQATVTPSAHTPGPWTLKPCSHGGQILWREKSREQQALQILPDADARLIAAAPDLLSVAHWALARLVSVSDLSDWNSEAMQLQIALRAAIKKAEGHEP